MTRGSKTKADDKPAGPPPTELVNPGTSGLVYDEAGHSVGGGSRVTIDGDPDHVAMRQLVAGHLLAQRGDTWLTVRDGQLVDPAPSPSPPSTDAAPLLPTTDAADGTSKEPAE